MRFPIEKPNTAEASSTRWTLSLRWMVNTATAWLTSEMAAASRGSRWSATTLSETRPTIAIEVITLTASPALRAPIFGSSIAI